MVIVLTRLLGWRSLTRSSQVRSHHELQVNELRQDTAVSVTHERNKLFTQSPVGVGCEFARMKMTYFYHISTVHSLYNIHGYFTSLISSSDRDPWSRQLRRLQLGKVPE